ncbi:MAG: tripartite tricarboxylate transporter TctB family protein [Betaproteobacteria bacterium]|nr:tripartite tricarboxylate transporter TctB family protein [Betaproteobacteria bacterium]
MPSSPIPASLVPKRSLKLMDTNKLKKAGPYAVVLVVTAALYGLAGQIDYTPRHAQLGPDFWPKLCLALAALTCLYEIGRALLRKEDAAEVSGIAEALDHDQIEAEAPPKEYPALLAAGAGLTLAYAVLVSVLGFVLATFGYLVAFMYFGRYRNHLVIWIASLAGTFAFAAVFLKLVYVSLPRGEEPFAQVTQLVMNLLGVR